MIDILQMERAPTHPGEMLLEEFLKPLGVSQSDFAKHVGISFPRLNDLIHARRGVSVDTALRLGQVLGTSPDLWLSLQQSWDLWQAARGKAGLAISKLQPISESTAAKPTRKMATA